MARIDPLLVSLPLVEAVEATTTQTQVEQVDPAVAVEWASHQAVAEVRELMVRDLPEVLLDEILVAGHRTEAEVEEAHLQ